MALGTLDVRVFWPWDTGDPPGTHPIPTGWTRDLKFDGRFLQGSDNTFMGSANSGAAHNHTDAGHTHTGDPHTHTFSAASATNDRWYVVPPGDPPPPQVFTAAERIHSHASEISNAATITYSTDAATINTTDMKPPWVQAIILKPDDINQDIPENAVCFGDSATPPTGYSITDGDGGITPDLDGLFVIGAAFMGVGGGTGGSLTHTHVSPDHDHDPHDHLHTATLCGDASDTQKCKLDTPFRETLPSCHHLVTLTTQALADVSNTAATVDNYTDSQPDFIKLLGIQNTSGGATTPVGVVVPFVGRYDDLPAGWVLCDGDNGTEDCKNKQLKITTTGGEIGDTGGSNTHTHTVASHGHTHTGGHTHYTSAATTGHQLVNGGLFVDAIQSPHTFAHSWTVGSTVPTMQNAAITLSTDDGRFNYRTVIWVKYIGVTYTVHIRGGHLKGGAIAAA